MLGIGRKTVLPLALAAGIGGPYLYSSSGQLMEQAGELVPSWAASQTKSWSTNSQRFDEGNIDLKEQPSQIAKRPSVVSLEEAFRLDITSAWVLSRWSRVSTQLSTIDMQGLRVPLVTGGSANDVAGALTYYFDESDGLKQVSFRGTTGDPSRLIYWLQAQYGFRPQRAAPGLKRFVVRYNGEEISEMEVHPAAIIHGGASLSRYDIYLTMRPRQRKF